MGFKVELILSTTLFFLPYFHCYDATTCTNMHFKKTFGALFQNSNAVNNCARKRMLDL